MTEEQAEYKVPRRLERYSHLFVLRTDGSIETNKMLLTLAETARALGYGSGTIRNKMVFHPDDPLGCGLTPVKMGRSIRFLITDVVRVAQTAKRIEGPAPRARTQPRGSNAARRPKKPRKAPSEG